MCYNECKEGDFPTLTLHLDYTLKPIQIKGKNPVGFMTKIYPESEIRHACDR